MVCKTSVLFAKSLGALNIRINLPRARISHPSYACQRWLGVMLDKTILRGLFSHKLDLFLNNLFVLLVLEDFQEKYFLGDIVS